jgi:hypothetical protein
VILSSIRRDELEVWHSAGIVKQAVDGNIHSEQRGRLADVGQHLPLSSMGQALRKQESTNRSLCGVIIHSFWLLFVVNGLSLYDTKFSLNCLLSTAILN